MKIHSITLSERTRAWLDEQGALDDHVLSQRCPEDIQERARKAKLCPEDIQEMPF